MKPRKTYIDFVKVIAIFLVLLNHTGTRGFFIASQKLESVFYPFYLCSAVIIKVAVPWFFMASGALLLAKEETIKDVLTKRFIKFLLSLIVFSGIVYLYNIASGEVQEGSIRSFAIDLYTGKISGHFWYLYAYLAYILMLPLIRKFVKVLSWDDFKWILLTHLVAQLLPIIAFLILKEEIAIQGGFNLFISINYLLYPIIGYFIDGTEINQKHIRMSLIACALSIAVTCFMIHYKGIITGRWDEGFIRNTVFIHAGALFYLLKCLFEKHRLSDGIKKSIATIGSVTFGIYVLEYVYRKMTEPVFFVLEPYLPTYIATVVWILVACIFGGLATYTLKHIPGIRRIL